MKKIIFTIIFSLLPVMSFACSQEWQQFDVKVTQEAKAYSAIPVLKIMQQFKAQKDFNKLCNNPEQTFITLEVQLDNQLAKDMKYLPKMNNMQRLRSQQFAESAMWIKSKIPLPK